MDPREQVRLACVGMCMERSVGGVVCGYGYDTISLPSSPSGKTMLARAVAKESGFVFINMDFSQVGTVHIGDGGRDCVVYEREKEREMRGYVDE